MLITHNGLLALLDAGIVRGARKAHVNAASLDITLGSLLLVEAPPGGCQAVVDLSDKQIPAMRQIDLIKAGYYDLVPGEFCLGSSVESFYMPNDVAAEYKLQSSLARAGLNHALAGWADPGWHGSVLTLELSNLLRYHSLRLRPGMKIGQVVFWRGEEVPEHASYSNRGKYNGDRTVQASKGLS